MFGKLAKQTDECMLEQSLVALNGWTPAELLVSSFDRKNSPWLIASQDGIKPAVLLPRSQRESTDENRSQPHVEQGSVRPTTTS